ncbi:hypothetical protein FACS189485_18130 [Spirochaetia bacterium]|nr:hypothetical protein FACS189485_18130 [Spirochaetia bacterium]
MEIAQKKFLTKTELADLLKVSWVTLDKRRKDGILPFHKIGSRVIYIESDVEIFLKNTEASITVGVLK